MKRKIAKDKIKKEHRCVEYCPKCERKYIIIDGLADANVPVEYWTLFMKTFAGSTKLKEIIENYTRNIKEKYSDGKSICLSGTQGTGKTMSSICILRSAFKAGFSIYYISAADMLSELTDYKTSHDIRNKLRNVDFLVIDELDSRFFTSDSVKELFAGIYENIFRHRAQSLLPTIICTNETETILNVFSGQAVRSIASLNDKYLEICPIIGQDFRRKK